MSNSVVTKVETTSEDADSDCSSFSMPGIADNGDFPVAGTSEGDNKPAATVIVKSEPRVANSVAIKTEDVQPAVVLSEADREASVAADARFARSLVQDDMSCRLVKRGNISYNWREIAEQDAAAARTEIKSVEPQEQTQVTNKNVRCMLSVDTLLGLPHGAERIKWMQYDINTAFIPCFDTRPRVFNGTLDDWPRFRSEFKLWYYSQAGEYKEMVSSHPDGEVVERFDLGVLRFSHGYKLALDEDGLPSLTKYSQRNDRYSWDMPSSCQWALAPPYDSTNEMLWALLSDLLSLDARMVVSPCGRTKNGCKAWALLTAHYEAQKQIQRRFNPCFIPSQATTREFAPDHPAFSTAVSVDSSQWAKGSARAVARGNARPFHVINTGRTGPTISQHNEQTQRGIAPSANSTDPHGHFFNDRNDRSVEMEAYRQINEGKRKLGNLAQVKRNRHQQHKKSWTGSPFYGAPTDPW